MNLLFFLTFLLFLVACDEKYGEKTADFVNKQVNPLSLKIANTAYEKKLAQGYVLEYSRLMIEIENSFDIMVKYTPILDKEIHTLTLVEAQEYRKNLIENESKLLRLKSHIISLEKEQQNLDEICLKMNGHELREIIQKDIFQMTVPGNPSEIFVSNNFIETLVKNGIHLFTAYSKDKQNSLMEEAISEIPQKIAKPEQLMPIYVKNCRVSQEAFKAKEEIKAFLSTLEESKKVLNESLIRNQRIISIVGSRIYQEASRHLHQEFGIDSIDENERNMAMISRIGQHYAILVNNDFRIMKSMTKARNKEEFLLLKEEWDDRLRERNLFLMSVRETWPFYQEKNQETIERKIFVEQYAKHVLTKVLR